MHDDTRGQPVARHETLLQIIFISKWKLDMKAVGDKMLFEIESVDLDLEPML